MHLKKHLSSHIPGWTSEPQSQTRNRNFNCRFLVKPPDDKDKTVEEKQQRVSKYESMQISAILAPENFVLHLESDDVPESSDFGPNADVICLVRKIPNEKPSNTIEQFTVKLDTTWKIIAVDNSWLTSAYANYLNKVRVKFDFCTIRSLRYPKSNNNNGTLLYFEKKENQIAL